MPYESSEVVETRFYIETDDGSHVVLQRANNTYIVVPLDAYIKAIAANPDAIIVGDITRDSNDTAISASVVWPDGDVGTYTAVTLSTEFPGFVDSHTVTKGTKTYTQPAMVRNENGAIINRPAIVVS